MTTCPLTASIDSSWFNLGPQKQPVHEKRFLEGVEFLTHHPELGKSQPSLVDYAIGQIRSVDLTPWPASSRIHSCVLNCLREWPLVKIGGQALPFPKSNSSRRALNGVFNSMRVCKKLRKIASC